MNTKIITYWGALHVGGTERGGIVRKDNKVSKAFWKKLAQLYREVWSKR